MIAHAEIRASLDDDAEIHARAENGPDGARVLVTVTIENAKVRVYLSPAGARELAGDLSDAAVKATAGVAA